MSCDNASNNDSMITELSKLVTKFPGAANQTRCFLHILNLVVKSIIKQFDLPKTPTGRLNDALLDLAGDLENEELKAQNDINNDEDDDNAEGGTWGLVDVPDGASEDGERLWAMDIHGCPQTGMRVLACAQAWPAYKHGAMMGVPREVAGL